MLIRLELCECKCGAAKDVSKIFEQEKVPQFLMGLDSDQFSTVRSNILSMEPLPNLNKAYAISLREERQQSLVRGVESKPAADGVAFRAVANIKPRLGSRPKCTHCQKLAKQAWQQNHSSPESRWSARLELR